MLRPNDPPLPFPWSSQLEGEVRELRCHYGSALYRVIHRRSGNPFMLQRRARGSGERCTELNAPNRLEAEGGACQDGFMLVVVEACFEVDWTRPAWIEDELVRRGARDAHIAENGAVSIVVEARSRAEASDLARDLLERVGATKVEIAGQQARVRTREAARLL
jgi:hypothetical protein